MFPSFDILGRTFYSYSVMAAVGLLIAGVFICRQAGKRGLDTNRVIILLLLICVGIMAGGHILYGITNFDKLRLFKEVTDVRSFFQTVGTIFGGSVFYGGLIGGAATGFVSARIMKLETKPCMDIIAPGIPLFHSFARVGCFLGGCCYGVECDIGFTYTNSLSAAANGVSRFPVQLLEAGGNVVIFLILWYLLEKGKLRGRLLSLYLILYPILRFLDEFLRGDAIRGFVGPLSTSQFISILLFIVGITTMIIGSRQAKRKEDA